MLQIFTGLAMIPFGALMFPIIDHYNWKRPRNEKLVDRLLLIQKIFLFIQILSVAIYLLYKN